MAEILILTVSITAGSLSLWAMCSDRITQYINTVLAVIASPTP